MLAVNNTNRTVKVRLHTVGLSVDGKDILCAWEASSFFTRLRGLHGVPPLQMGEALIITPCNSIHTMTMRSTIDVAFVDTTGVITQACSVLRRRFVRCHESCAVIEMPKGTLSQFGLNEGKQLHRDKGHWR